ncbi:MAG: D-tyrosyl-tRNA(Tyr) deacylase [Gemmatimonadales bacterium]|nr:MAG: D-tyrosyl-tRNA(Tyr) deacylase [Gemmatimonadales bacterium]
MRVVVQRVNRASVRVAGRLVGETDLGLLVLVGFSADDTEETLCWMADKLRGLRIFSDSTGRMNLDLEAVCGSLLVVSQFTLYGDVAKGRRPSFVGAAPPEEARSLYERFLVLCEDGGAKVASGEFGGMMDVDLVNSGPVTLVIER